VAQPARLDGPKMALIYGKDSLKRQTLRRGHNRCICKAQWQVAILED
jgi:hypothetical protein